MSIAFHNYQLGDAVEVRHNNITCIGKIVSRSIPAAAKKSYLVRVPSGQELVVELQNLKYIGRASDDILDAGSIIFSCPKNEGIWKIRQHLDQNPVKTLVLSKYQLVWWLNCKMSSIVTPTTVGVNIDTIAYFVNSLTDVMLNHLDNETVYSMPDLIDYDVYYNHVKNKFTGLDLDEFLDIFHKSKLCRVFRYQHDLTRFMDQLSLSTYEEFLDNWQLFVTKLVAELLVDLHQGQLFCFSKYFLHFYNDCQESTSDRFMQSYPLYPAPIIIDQERRKRISLITLEFIENVTLQKDFMSTIYFAQWVANLREPYQTLVTLTSLYVEKLQTSLKKLEANSTWVIRFQCEICYLVAEPAEKCKTCRNQVCKECYQRLTRCSFCRTQINGGTRFDSDYEYEDDASSSDISWPVSMD